MNIMCIANDKKVIIEKVDFEKFLYIQLDQNHPEFNIPFYSNFTKSL